MKPLLNWKIVGDASKRKQIGTWPTELPAPITLKQVLTEKGIKSIRNMPKLTEFALKDYEIDYEQYY